MIARLHELKQSGTPAVNIDGLIKTLTPLEQSLAQGVNAPEISSSELIKIQASFDLEHYRGVWESAHRLFESVITTANAAIKALFLINGGGCVALLALAGQLASAGRDRTAAVVFALPLVMFGSGVGLAAVTACTLAMTQKCYAQKWDKTGAGFTVATIVLGVGSLALFGLACWHSYSAMLQFAMRTE